jgi:hypothetical protein
MGARGPKPGFKRARAAELAAREDAERAHAALMAVLSPPEQPRVNQMPPSQLAGSTYADSVNPAKLEGDELQKLARTHGIAISQMRGQTDERVRTMIRYAVARKYESEGA